MGNPKHNYDTSGFQWRAVDPTAPYAYRPSIGELRVDLLNVSSGICVFDFGVVHYIYTICVILRAFPCRIPSIQESKTEHIPLDLSETAREHMAYLIVIDQVVPMTTPLFGPTRRRPNQS